MGVMRPISPLISRQSELGGLGAYLSSLRAIRLVLPGDLRASPAAREILDALWDEPSHGARIASYEAYALSALDLKKRTIERKQFGITLAAIGERTRLNCLRDRKRKEQQGRLHEILFAGAKDPLTFPLSELIRRAADDNVDETKEFLKAALRGKWGALPGITREQAGSAIIVVSAITDDAAKIRLKARG